MNYLLTENAVAKLRRVIAPRSGNTGAIAATGEVRCNRNGRYRVYEARGKKSLVVNVAIRRNGNL